MRKGLWGVYPYNQNMHTMEEIAANGFDIVLAHDWDYQSSPGVFAYLKKLGVAAYFYVNSLCVPYMGVAGFKMFNYTFIDTLVRHPELFLFTTPTPKLPTYNQLDTTAAIGATSVTLLDGSDFETGDTFTLLGTAIESKVIDSKTGDNTLNFTGGLTANHYGGEHIYLISEIAQEASYPGNCVLDITNPAARALRIEQYQMYSDICEADNRIYLDVWDVYHWAAYWTSDPMYDYAGNAKTASDFYAGYASLLTEIEAAGLRCFINAIWNGERYDDAGVKVRTNALRDSDAVDVITMEAPLRYRSDALSSFKTEPNFKLNIDCLAEVGDKLFWDWAIAPTGVVLTHDVVYPLFKFGLGSFMLGASANAIFCWKYQNPSSPIANHSPYHTDQDMCLKGMGAALDDYYIQSIAADGGGNINIYMRDFEYGKVLVNPNATATASAIALGGTYYDPQGNPVTEFPGGAHEGGYYTTYNPLTA